MNLIAIALLATSLALIPGPSTASPAPFGWHKPRPTNVHPRPPTSTPPPSTTTSNPPSRPTPPPPPPPPEGPSGTTTGTVETSSIYDDRCIGYTSSLCYLSFPEQARTTITCNGVERPWCEFMLEQCLRNYPPVDCSQVTNTSFEPTTTSTEPSWPTPPPPPPPPVDPSNTVTTTAETSIIFDDRCLGYTSSVCYYAFPELANTVVTCNGETRPWCEFMLQRCLNNLPPSTDDCSLVTNTAFDPSPTSPVPNWPSWPTPPPDYPNPPEPPSTFTTGTAETSIIFDDRCIGYTGSLCYSAFPEQANTVVTCYGEKRPWCEFMLQRCLNKLPPSTDDCSLVTNTAFEPSWTSWAPAPEETPVSTL
ncbi:hypothetical protein HDU96_000728 [Phlyctochytrium bullatum]|nr:hypothetical protein HDU96_000728 [Phlyctochytrium bullatum]